MLTTAKDQLSIAPLVQNSFKTLSGIRFTTACFQGPGNELSLGPLKKPADVARNPILVERVRAAMCHLDAERVYAPSPTEFNGKIINNAELSDILVLGKGVILFRNGLIKADGTFLRDHGHAGIFSAGGCGLVVATLHDHMIFAHGGRDCVIDKPRVLTGAASRGQESVVDFIVSAFLGLGYSKDDLSQAQAWMMYSIRPVDFLHRYDNIEHGEYNKRVGPDLKARGLSAGLRETVEGVELDIPIIAKAQFVARGVPEQNISLGHAYLHDELPHTRNGGGRYLVAVVRQ